MARTLVMGILIVTPDSVSDGGRWVDTDAAVAHGLAMVADGAAIGRVDQLHGVGRDAAFLRRGGEDVKH